MSEFMRISMFEPKFITYPAGGWPQPGTGPHLCNRKSHARVRAATAAGIDRDLAQFAPLPDLVAGLV